MRWQDGRESENVEDRRGQNPGRMRMGGGIPIGRGGLGIGGIIVVVVLSLVFGIDPMMLLGGGDPQTSQQTSQTQIEQPSNAPGARPDDELGRFVSVVLADTEDTWREQFRNLGQTYREPALVLFSGMVNSGCGTAQSAMGPFYCPLDQKVYIDLSFYRELRDRFQAPGDFAQAYVIAHEVGHHVQNLLGISDEVRRAQQRAGNRADVNALSVRQELQADCFAGLWANNAHKQRQIIEPGDVEEALTAASAIGDDRIQRGSSGTVSPESFTHGSATQRVYWFRMGLESGRLESCDTFSARQL